MAISAEQIAEWIDRWAGPLRAWLRSRCANPDDIVQEAFCRLVQQSKIPERIAPWLFHVAINLVREESRRTKRRRFRESVVAKAEQHFFSVSQSLEEEDHRKPFDSDIRLEIEARPRGVLTAASWVRWEAIDMLDQGNSSATREGILGRDDVESSPLSVRSKIPSF